MSPILRTIVLRAAVFFVVFVYSLGLRPIVLAQTVPSFTSCIDPQGTIKVRNPSGTHGIAGETGQYSGSDTVWRLSGNTLTQCFCSEDGDGIQTNWWKASSLTATDITVLEREGWEFIPNGSLWGLDEGAYLAKNAPYICGGGRVGGASDTKSGDVLGLATTGDSITLFGLAGLGAVLLLLAIVLRRYSNDT